MAEDTWDNMTNEELCLEYQKTRDEKLFEYFTERNRGLGHRFMAHMYAYFPKWEDEYEGVILRACYRSMLRYDAQKGTKWSTLYTFYIKSELNSLFGDNDGPCHIPRYVGWRRADVREQHPEYIWDAISLDQAILNQDLDKDITILDTIKDDRIDIEGDMIESDTHEKLLKMLKRIMSGREFYCVTNYFGFYGEPKTLESIGKEFGVTRERIRQLTRNGLKKLNSYLELHPEDKTLFYPR